MAPTPPRVVSLRISEPVLKDILRLDDLSLAGASLERSGDCVTLVLYVERADAPPGATEMCPVYQRDTEVADPVSMTGIGWYRNGFQIRPPTPPEPEPPSDGLARPREAGRHAR